MKVASLVNTYPQPSHTFIRREINTPIRRGLDVHRFAMRDDRAHLANTVDISEHILSADRKNCFLKVWPRFSGTLRQA